VLRHAQHERCVRQFLTHYASLLAFRTPVQEATVAKPWRNASGCPRVLAKRTRFAEVSLTNQYEPFLSCREAPHLARQSIV